MPEPQTSGWIVACSDHCGEGDVHLFRRLRAFSGVDNSRPSRFGLGTVSTMHIVVDQTSRGRIIIDVAKAMGILRRPLITAASGYLGLEGGRSLLSLGKSGRTLTSPRSGRRSRPGPRAPVDLLRRFISTKWHVLTINDMRSFPRCHLKACLYMRHATVCSHAVSWRSNIQDTSGELGLVEAGSRAEVVSTDGAMLGEAEYQCSRFEDTSSTAEYSSL
jgi:hypothetical protein